MSPLLACKDDRVQAFIDHLAGGGLVEANDWMPDEYRRSVIKFMEMHGNSEYMGALLERDWIAKAPTLERKLAIAAKVQDEVGHAQLVYQLCEDLGRTREAILDDLTHGRAKYLAFFHYPTQSWADCGIIAWLSDTAAMVAQEALTRSSYAPYRRALVKINWEEAFHVAQGKDLIRKLVQGTAAQRKMAQDALDTWWPRLLAFHGPPTPAEEDMDLTVWKLKSRPNEELRQRFIGATVPAIKEMGLELNDPALRWDEAEQKWHYTVPEWCEVRQIGKGFGPASRERAELRRREREASSWVLETLQNASERVA